MNITKPLSVWLERSVLPAFTEIVTQRTDQFKLATSPAEADVIIFEIDNPSYVRATPEFRQWSNKCIVVSECDEPTYFLPACYASNKRGWLSKGRTKTITYLLTQQSIPHPYITYFDSNKPRKYLYSFKGGSTSWVRKKIFRLPHHQKDVCIEEANHYLHWSYEEAFLDKKKYLQKQYAELLEQSSFFLCPQGAGVSSIRLFEVMLAGRVPVIISDNWIPVEDIPWNDFSLFISEKDLPKMDQIIRSHELSARELGRKAHVAWEQYCSPGPDSALLIRYIQSIQSNRNENRERFIRFLFPILDFFKRMRKMAFVALKYMILRAYDLTGRKFPYSLNRPVEEQITKIEKAVKKVH